jgi:OmpA family
MRYYYSLILVAFATTFYGQDSLKTSRYILHFGFDKTFPPSEMAKLKSIADTLQISNDSFVVVEGHSDPTGPKAYNQLLSERRAQQVRDWLIQHGSVKKDSISAKGFGEKKPLHLNKNAKGRALNRRAEVIIIFKRPSQPKKTFKAPPSAYGDLFKNLRKKQGTIYCIDTQRDTTIITPEGHTVKIPALAFRNSNGSIPETCVNIDILEVMDKSEMFKNRLITLGPNGKVLESVNSVRLETNQVNLVRNITFIIADKKENVKTDVIAYKGEKSKGMVQWNTNTGSNVVVVTDEQIAGYCDCVYKNFAATSGTRAIKPARCPFFFCKMGNAFRKKYKASPDYTKEAIKNKYPKPESDNCKELFPNVPEDLSDKILKIADFGTLDTTLQIKRRELNKVADRRTKTAKKAYLKMLKENQTNNLTDIYRAEAIKNIDSSYAKMNQALADNQGNSFYIWNLAELGWQDLHSDLTGEGSSIIKVNMQPDIDKECMVFFKNNRSLVPLAAQGDHYASPSLPNGKAATILLIQNVQGVPHYFIQDIKLNGNVTLEPVLKPSSITELESLISTLR